LIRKLFTDSLLYAIGPQIPRFAGILLLPVLTKYLHSRDYAIYGIALAYIGALGGLKELGFSQVMVNYYYRYTSGRWKFVWRQLLGILNIWGILYAIILGIILFLTLSSKIGSEIWTLLLLVTIPVIFFENTIMFGSRFFQVSQKPIPMALNAAFSGVLSVIITYIAVVFWETHYMGFFIASFSASFFSFLFFLYPVYFSQKIIPIFRFKKSRILPHLRVGLPTIPHNYSAYLLNTSDRVILDLYKTPLSPVGQYNFAYFFGNYVDMIGGAIGMAAGPFYFRLFAKKTELAEQKARFLTFGLQTCFLVPTMIAMVWCKELFALLSSDPVLAASYPYAIIIIMSYIFRPMYWAPVSRLGFEEKTQHLWKISFIGGVLNVVLNLIFVPFFGIYATVVSTFIGLMYIGFAGYFLKAFKQINKLNYYPIRWLLLISLCTLFVFIIRDWPIEGKWLITLVLAGIFLAIIFLNRVGIKKLNDD
jgi:O-antigen/teichoic acid export membrane protein